MKKSIIKQIFIIIIFVILCNFSTIFLNFFPTLLHGATATCCDADLTDAYRNVTYLILTNINIYLSTFVLHKILKLKKHITNKKIIYILIFICLILANVRNLFMSVHPGKRYPLMDSPIASLLILFTCIFIAINIIWLVLKLKKIKTPKL